MNSLFSKRTGHVASAGLRCVAHSGIYLYQSLGRASHTVLQVWLGIALAFVALLLATWFIRVSMQRSEARLRTREERHLEWLAFLAHDLRVPLERVLSGIRTLEYGNEPISEDARKVLENADREVLQSMNLIGAISMFASLDSGITREFATARLDQILVDVTESFEFEADNRGVKLTLTIGEDVGNVSMERVLIRRCIDNLVSNALSYTAAGGSINVCVAQRDKMVDIRVADSGSGIPPELLPRIFDFGFQGDGARPARTGSHGLGLAFVKRVAEIHKGRITAENLEGGGAQFTLSLPSPR